MADLIALLAACVALPLAGAAMYHLWLSRPAGRRYGGLTVGQIPQVIRRRMPMAVRRAGAAA